MHAGAASLRRPRRAGYSRPVRKRLACVLGVLWVLAIGRGFQMLWTYSATPGAATSVPAEFPGGSRVRRVPGRATLIMFAHPRCPCTRASLHELQDLLARRRDRVDAHVLFLRPPGTEEGFEETDLWRSAAGMPGVAVATDERGEEAARFGARTSGHMVLYDGGGRLLFQGGITGARGHEGDNVWRAQASAVLEKGPARTPETPVFGCGLCGPE